MTSRRAGPFSKITQADYRDPPSCLLRLRMVWQVKNAVGIPVMGMGGISTANDAVEMMLAGADLISVGTALFTEPLAPVTITNGLMAYLERKNIEHVTEITGKVQPY